MRGKQIDDLLDRILRVTHKGEGQVKVLMSFPKSKLRILFLSEKVLRMDQNS